MVATNVAKVVTSKDAKFPVGSRVVTHSGWVKKGKGKIYEMMKEDQVSPLFLLKHFYSSHAILSGWVDGIIQAPDIGKLSQSYHLGSCGMTGNSAYFAFLNLCQPKSGERVLVNGAAGAVGSLVGQIAKIKGCSVIGLAGSEEKCNQLIKLGFDHAFNYKKVTIEEAIKKGAPNGVDCFFDNVGGPASTTVLSLMNRKGRVAICGAISTYNDKEGEPTMAPSVQLPIGAKELKLEGFSIASWRDQWNEGVAQMVTHSCIQFITTITTHLGKVAS